MTSHKKQWEKFMEAWNKVGSPGRPTEEEAMIIFKYMQQYLKSRKNTRIVILGCTPEYRDMTYLCSRMFNSKVFCVDMSEEIHDLMSTLTIYRNKNETFIHANWLKIPILPESIDIIIGDNPLSNQTKEAQEELMKELTRIMKKDALFIARDDTIPKGFPKNINLEKEFICQAKKVLDGKMTAKDGSAYIGDVCVRAAALNTDYRGYAGYHEKQFNRIYNKYRKKKDSLGKMIFIMLDIFHDTFISSGDKAWTVYPEKMFEKKVSKYFAIKKRIATKSVQLSNGLKIYIMKRK